MNYQKWCTGLLAFFLLLISCAGTQNAQKPSAQPGVKPRAVMVTITRQAIEATETTFAVDTPYNFTVTNQEKIATDFFIRERPLVPEGSPPAKEGVLYMIPSTQLPPGATRHFTYQFPITSPHSNLELTTNLPGPTGAGKILPIKAVLAK